MSSRGFSCSTSAESASASESESSRRKRAPEAAAKIWRQLFGLGFFALRFFWDVPLPPYAFAFDFVLFFSVLLCFWLCCRAGFSCYEAAWQKCKFCCMFAIRKVFFLLLFWFFSFLLIAAPFCRFFLIYIWFLVVFKLLMCCPPVVVVVAVAFGELALVCCYCNLLKFHNASERHCLYVFMFINSTRRVAYAAMAYSH